VTSTILHAPWALLPAGWARDVTIAVGPDGVIVSVLPETAPGTATRLAGPVLPGMTNLHSHAFQFAMAGLAETRSPDGEDHFWSWRETMYRFLARLTPEDVEAIAAQLFVSLLKGGFTTVTEFHYLHTDPSGTPYADPAEMARRVLAAARAAGIARTMLPSLYRQGGFGRAPGPGQRRFILPAETVLGIIAALRREAEGDPLLRVGAAPHSLRAVATGELASFATDLWRNDPVAPLHIHAAEQPREVEECLAATGQRPVAHLLASLPIDRRVCLIHATHMDDGETAALASCGAVAGLCPTTEANLGDGIFPFVAFRDGGGTFGIGTDSHVGTDAADELRQLEFSQRLAHLKRAVAATAAIPSTGTALWQAAASAGAQAAAQPCGAIAPGLRADLVVLEGAHPMLAGRGGDAIADTLVFGPARALVRDVLVGGRAVIRDRHHEQEQAIADRFAATMRRLLG
jgi:formimidoylglutamate deiminase